MLNYSDGFMKYSTVSMSVIFWTEVNDILGKTKILSYIKGKYRNILHTMKLCKIKDDFFIIQLIIMTNTELFY